MTGRYEKKRDFRKTPEPKAGGKAPAKKGSLPRFVVQEHNATSHHFDFRLEIGGALVSWAVPKGPSTDPAEKRLAIRTEDPPLDYAEFEGVIPEGQYGAVSVLIWERVYF
ncbi:MAG: DNA polymerase ligase N-terminal domain-containing protein [Limibacillus sp.]